MARDKDTPAPNLAEELTNKLGSPGNLLRQKYDLAESGLSEWLQFEKWSYEEAMCLLCGIEPQGARIHWRGYENFDGVHIDQPKISNAQIFGEWHEFYAIPYLDDSQIDVDGAKRAEWKDLLANDGSVQYKAKRLKEIEVTLRHAVVEAERKSPELDTFRNDSRPPSFWIEWGKTHNVLIPWLSWAETQELIADPDPPERNLPDIDINFRKDQIDHNSEAKPQSGIPPRLETTYLNIIAGLLGLLFGETSYGKRNSVFRRQTDVINALLESYPQKPGIKKRTLEDKFAKANKSIGD